MKGFERPPIEVLSESDAIPEDHLVEPPEEFTHELVRDEPYWYDAPSESAADRILRAGTKVRLLGDGRVIDPRGLLVTIDPGALRKL